MKVILENLIHESLECFWCIGEAKRHDEKFEMAVVGREGCLIDAWGVDSDLVAPCSQIKFGIDCGTT